MDELKMFKIVVIGSSSVGKTKIAMRYIREEFNTQSSTTIGVEFNFKIVEYHNEKIKITVWDTAGQQKYKSLSRVYYKGASGIIIVYDITNRNSYEQVTEWLKLASEQLNINDCVIAIVGNKTDLQYQRQVTRQEAQQKYENQLGYSFWQVSARTGNNINKLFDKLIQGMYEKNRIQQHQGHDIGTNKIRQEQMEGQFRQTIKPKSAISEQASHNAKEKEKEKSKIIVLSNIEENQMQQKKILKCC